MNGLPIFGLFDFDKAYDSWNRLSSDIEEADLLGGQIKKVTDQNAYGIMLPLPKNARIRKQVVRDLAANESFGGDSLCEIEHLFYGDPLTDEFFNEQLAPGGGRKILIKSDAQKERFANEVIPMLGDKYFKVFRPMFNFIIAKIA